MPYNKNIRICTITGPTGSGKTSLVRGLLEAYPDVYRMVVSYTTRAPRESDITGEYVCDMEYDELHQFDSEERCLWLKHAHGNTYVTLKKSVDEAMQDSEHTYLMQLIPETVPRLREYVRTGCCSLFIYVLDESVLEERLKHDRKEDHAFIEKRMRDCKDWLHIAQAQGVPYMFIHNNGTVVEMVQFVHGLLK